ncbi:MAG: hypothetical protein RL139_596 [Gemmatimonadota bacterium]
MRTRSLALLLVLTPLAAPSAIVPSAGRGASARPVVGADTIRVTSAGVDTTVAVVASPAGGMVRADVLVRLFGGAVDALGPGRWRLGLGGAALDIAAGSPFAGYDGTTLPLVEPTREVAGAPMVALQLFTEIVPRFGIGITWDRAGGVLRRAAPAIARVPARAAPVVPVATPSAAAPAAATPGAVPVGGSVAAASGTGLSRRYTVVVDAGHGGRDPGMRGAVVDGQAFSEAKVTLQVAERLRVALQDRGFRVLMTRTRDTLINLDHRGPIANRGNGDLFISVHVNAANPRWNNPTAARGFETFYLSTARTEDEAHVANMENDVVRFETEVEAPRGNDALAFIMNDLARNEHLRESSEIATTIQRKLNVIHPGPNRGVKQAGLRVLVTAYMPAVLVEIGFGTNPAEARWMLSERGQDDAAQSIADAAAEYLRDYDRRRSRAVQQR